MPVRPRLRHRFDVGFAEARAIQERLRDRVERADRLGPVRTVAGVDVSYDRGSPILYGAVVVLDAASGETIETAGVRMEAQMPYVPGYLSFREVPPLLAAFAKLRKRPDLLVCDGHGRAHPRRFGIACHLGVLLDLPSIGSAKSRLVGTHDEPGAARGSHTPLRDGREVIGSVLRTRVGVKPIFASTGHRVSLTTARRTLLRLAPSLRLPLPIRAAHEEVNRLRRADGRRR